MRMHFMQHQLDQMMIGELVVLTMIVSELGTYILILYMQLIFGYVHNWFFRYWLYAAIKFKCLLVTNDEMRDHTFQLLGNDFFPKWKERHQVSRTDFAQLKKSPPSLIVCSTYFSRFQEMNIVNYVSVKMIKS